MPDSPERDEFMQRDLQYPFDLSLLHGTTMPPILEKLEEYYALGSTSVDTSHQRPSASGVFTEIPDPAVMSNLTEEQKDLEAAKLLTKDSALELSNMITIMHFVHVLNKLWRCKLQNITREELWAYGRLLKRLQISMKSIQLLNYPTHDFEDIMDWHKSLEMLSLDLTQARSMISGSADGDVESDDSAIYVTGDLEDYSLFLTLLMKELRHLRGEEETSSLWAC